MLRREVPEAREILRNLIVGRIVFTPRPETRLYEFFGRGSLGRPRGRDGQFSFGGDPGGVHQEYVRVGVVRRGRRGPRRLGSTRSFGQDGGAHRRLQGLRLGTDRSSSQPQFFTWSHNSQSCEPSASDASNYGTRRLRRTALESSCEVPSFCLGPAWASSYHVTV